MVICPICIVDAGVIIVGTYFGIPLSIIFTMIGVLTAFISITTSKWIYNRYEKKIRISYILIIYLFITFISYFITGYI